MKKSQLLLAPLRRSHEPTLRHACRRGQAAATRQRPLSRHGARGRLGGLLIAALALTAASAVLSPVDADAFASANYLVAGHSGKCIDITGVSTADGALAQQYDCLGSGAANQQFELVPVGTTGYYQVIARHSGKCLDVTGVSLAQGARIQQYTCLGSVQYNQQWRPISLGDGYYQLVARHSGQCLDVSGGGTNYANGAVLQQWGCLGPAAYNQLFAITGSVPPLQAAPVEWSSFGQESCIQVSSDQINCGITSDSLPRSEDDIHLAQSAGQTGLITVFLETSPAVTWWKEIKAIDFNGNVMNAITTQDYAHGPIAMSLPAAKVAALVFSKATFLGQHTAVYDLRGVDGKSGRTLTFSWTRDT